MQASAQDFNKQFLSLTEKNDSSGVVKLLARWEQSKPKDPELFIAYFNYYVGRSTKEVISIGGAQKGNESLALENAKTGEQAGFINSEIAYNEKLVNQGLAYLDKGLALYPNRLDMRFGKIYMLGKIEDYKAFTNQVKDAIDYNAQIHSKWLWKEGKPLDDAENYFLTSVQDYVTTIYNSGDGQLPLMREISENVLKYYPRHIESLSNVAVSYMVAGDLNKGLEYLLKAETINPKDVVVLNNIAEAYHRKKDKPNALLYYQKMIKAGTKEDIEFAREQIKKLD